jgi:MinD superfamily P-loop ATPase
MKQVAVISGKGGTGKTTITAALALVMKDTLFADCDVDAPDLHLLLQPEIRETQVFIGLKLAYIDPEKCTQCGECRENCRFSAITEEFVVDRMRCEGCSVCHLVCPAEAITMKERESGELHVSGTRAGTMVHARLWIAEEATGKLVAKVRERAKTISEEEGKGRILVDGPPGIGCPVIATLGNTNLALIITEPTVSGVHDLERVIGVARHFKVPVGVCINKFDLNPDKCSDIEKWCKEEDIPVLGRIPYDHIITKAMLEGKTVVEYSDGEVSRIVRELAKNVERLLSG